MKSLNNDVNAINLFAKNIDSTVFNHKNFNNSAEEGKIYKAVRKDGSSKNFNKILALNYLHLKINCPVILLVNLAGRLVNGLRGIIKQLGDDTVSVYFPDIKETHSIKRYLFSPPNYLSSLSITLHTASSCSKTCFDNIDISSMIINSVDRTFSLTLANLSSWITKSCIVRTS